MQKKNEIYDVSAELDNVFGAPGSTSRIEEANLAWEEYNAQVLLDARKAAHMSQQELADKIGANKSYVSRIERGLTIPSIATFYRLVYAMGLRVSITQ